MTEFDIFWAAFPRKTAKLVAMKAFVKARKLATLAQILDGVRRYVVAKPTYADYCHPSTWLNTGRWLDEPDQQVRNWTFECPHQPHCRREFDCVQKQRAS